MAKVVGAKNWTLSAFNGRRYSVGAPPPDGGGSVPAGAGTLNTLALAYGRDPSYTTTDLQTIADRFAIVIGTEGDSGFDPAVIKARRAGCICLSYANTSNVTEGDSLWDWAAANGHTAQIVLHSTSNDTVQDIDGTTYARTNGQPLYSYNNQPTRYGTNYYDADHRALLQQYIAWELTQISASYDGIFIDNSDRGDGYSGSITAGSAEGGITYPTNPQLSYGATAEGHANALKALLDTSINQSKFLVHNTSNFGLDLYPGPYWWNLSTTTCNGQNLSRGVAEAFTLMRGAFQEFKYNFGQTKSEFDNNYGLLREIWEARGSKTNALYIGWWMSSSYGGVARNDPRIQLYAMAVNLLYQFDALAMRYDIDEINNDPLNNDWFGAMGADLGTPSGNMETADNRVWSRQFTSGIVAVRFRTASGDNYTDSGNFDLGGTYRTVNADGTIGASVSQVTLRNAEAFVGIV